MRTTSLGEPERTDKPAGKSETTVRNALLQYEPLVSRV